MLDKLRAKEKVIGVKQCRRAVRDGSAKLVFLAADADPALTAPMEEECLRKSIPVAAQFTMRELGQAAGIQVGAAMVALLKND